MYTESLIWTTGTKISLTAKSQALGKSRTLVPWDFPVQFSRPKLININYILIKDLKDFDRISLYTSLDSDTIQTVTVDPARLNVCSVR